MCDPVTIGAVAAVASTVLVARSQQQQGRYQRNVAKYNARVAENQAQDVRRAGTEAENKQRQRTAQLLSKQRAQLGAANVDLTSGSALQLQEDTVTLGEADALRIRSNFEAQARSLETGASLTLNQGEFAASAGAQQSVGTILSGTAQTINTGVFDTGVSDTWYTPNSAANQPFAPAPVDTGFSPSPGQLNLGG